MLSVTTRPLREERRALMRFATRLCRSGADADDLVQEALMRMWRHQPVFPSDGHQRAWLKRVVFNSLIDGRRRDKRARDWIARSVLDELSAVTEPQALSTTMQRNLEALSVDYRNVLFLIDVCEESYQAAADKLDCPIGTVMSRLHRARRQLRNRLDSEGSPEAATATAA